jgi:hypothetical protein
MGAERQDSARECVTVLHTVSRLSILAEAYNRGINVNLPEKGIHLAAVLELLFDHVEEHVAD